MCGITGYFTSSGSPAVGEEDLRRAVVTLRKRGPDDEGIWSGGPEIGLGHTRLSILDLSSHGHQPMLSSNGRLAMVFNGEVYNFAEIRNELVTRGHRFFGSGDSEVILAAFQEWGVRDAVSRFIGMFAIALWDSQAGRLTLIRDRLGVKPLYYGWDGRTLWFGSELKALRAYGHWEPRIDRTALADFFRFSYIVEPLSIYEQVSKLPPGHLLELGRGGQPAVHQYWSVGDASSVAASANEEALAERLEALMTDAFNLRMISDVPVGVFLSGGVDSSALAALLRRDGPPIRTFTIGFDDARFNEAPYAEQVAKHLGTQHITQIVSESDAMQVLPAWGELFDEPFGDDSGIPTLLVSRLAAQHVKVVLSADGGDELFGGYTSYSAVLDRIQSVRRQSSMGRFARELAATMPWERLDRLFAGRLGYADPKRSLGRSMSLRLRYIRETQALSSPGGLFEHVLTSSYWHDADLDRLLGIPSPVSRPNCDDYPGDIGERMCLWDLHHYLAGDVLAKVDRATMAVSIEGREPLLDHRLVEFAFSLPYQLRRGTLGSKHLLRKVLYRHVPRELIDRPKKGFSAPIGRWMSGELKLLLDTYLDPRRITQQGILDPAVVAAVRRRFDAGDPFSVQRVWLLLAFQLWYARWMERLAGPPAAPSEKPTAQLTGLAQ
ncbi:MAG: asparagine synthase (glutamine-hydrolyzing) [Burkholderiaceae bacterium]